MTMAINFAMVKIYNEEFSFIKSLPGGLWPQNLTVWWLTIRSFNLLSHTTLWMQGHVRSCDKLKTFYLHYHNTYVTKPGRVVTYNKELLHKATSLLSPKSSPIDFKVWIQFTASSTILLTLLLSNYRTCFPKNS